MEGPLPLLPKEVHGTPASYLKGTQSQPGAGGTGNNKIGEQGQGQRTEWKQESVQSPTCLIDSFELDNNKQ